MRIFKTVIFSLIFSLLLNISCTKNLPQDIESTLSHYFIYKDLPSQKILLSSIKNSKQVDSLFHSILLKSKPGSFNIDIKDSKGEISTLGYKTPDYYDFNKEYPLIIYLHGGIGTSRTDKGKEAWPMFQFLQDSIDIFIASPSANRNCPWWTEAGLSRILASIRYMTLHYPINMDKIFLAGVSDGGTACYALANQTNSLFAGYFAISGLGSMVQKFGVNISPQNLNQENIYNINAENDRLYPPKYVKHFLTELKKSGVKVKSKFYQNEEHGFEYKNKETNVILKLINSWERGKAESTTHIFSNQNFYYNPFLSNIAFNKDDAFINFYSIRDTIFLRSNGISSCNIHLNKSTIYIKKQNSKIIKRKTIKNDYKNYLKNLLNSFHPKEYNKNSFNISME